MRGYLPMRWLATALIAGLIVFVLWLLWFAENTP
jgi:hypothetical protein